MTKFRFRLFCRISRSNKNNNQNQYTSILVQHSSVAISASTARRNKINPMCLSG